MTKLLKKALDILPLNGSKTKLGGLVALIGMLQSVDIPWSEILTMVQSHPTPTGLAIFVLGLAHKALKSKHPED